MSNYFIVISGPSGVGKTTIVSRLLSNKQISPLVRLVTCTTRQRREGEKDGIDYVFFTKEQFEKAIKFGDLLEHELIYGNYYGVLKSTVTESIKTNNVIASLGIQGAFNVRRLVNNSLLIFIEPPSIDELKRRLSARNTDISDLEQRVSKAKTELLYKDKFDVVLNNHNLDVCVSAVENFIKKTFTDHNITG